MSFQLTCLETLIRFYERFNGLRSGETQRLHVRKDGSVVIMPTAMSCSMWRL